MILSTISRIALHDEWGVSGYYLLSLFSLIPVMHGSYGVSSVSSFMAFVFQCLIFMFCPTRSHTTETTKIHILILLQGPAALLETSQE